MSKDFANSYKQMVWKHRSSEFARNCRMIESYKESLEKRERVLAVSELNAIYESRVKSLTERNEHLKREFPGIERFEE